MRHKHFGFTGSRTHTTKPQIETLYSILRELRDEGYRWMHNGDCKGYDFIAGKYWLELKQKIILHPPHNIAHRGFLRAHITCEPKSYLDRDRDIADCGGLLVGCPRTHSEQTRSGTWATVRYARKLRRKLILIYPDGTLEVDRYKPKS